MDDIQSVANEILAQGGGEINPLKLQKLLYYVQVYSLLQHDQPAFAAKLQAWDDGPVNRDIWDTFKRFGRNPITEPPGPRRPQQRHVMIAIVAVMATFGRLSGNELSGLTHQERPWVEAFAHGRNTEITMDDIKKGYVRIGTKVYPRPTTQEAVSQEIEQLIACLHPDRDNEDLVLQIAEKDYSLLTELVLTHTQLDYRVMADIVKGIASEWPSHPEAAERALLSSLDRPEPIIQREALRGLDEMWREGYRKLAPLVAQQALVVPRPKWAVMNG